MGRASSPANGSANGARCAPYERFLTLNFELYEADMQIPVINWCVGRTKDFSEQRRAEESFT